MARRGALFVALVAMLMAFAPFGAVPAQDTTDPASTYQWAVDAIGARQAHKVGTGKGIVIAIIDTGVDLEHEDLKAKLVPGRNVIDPALKPQDDDGQGTHVAGIAAAITGNGKGVMGIAPDAKIMPIKVLDADGDGDTDDVASGIKWAADHGAQVAYIGLESGIPHRVEPLRDAVRYAWTLGVVPIVTSGNQVLVREGFASENALVVAATTRAGGAPSYSSGTGNAKWGIAAPGGTAGDNDEDDILSTYWPHTEREPIGAQEFGRYAYESGTSMAAGHVAGAVAIMRSLGLSPQRSVDRLLETARDIGADGRDTEFGAGLLDLAAAVKGITPPMATTSSTAAAAPTSTTSVATTGAGRRPGTASRPAPGPTVTTAVGAAGGTGATFSPPTVGAEDTKPSGLSAAGPKPPADDGDGRGAGPAALAVVAVLSGSAAAGGWWWRRRSTGAGV